MTRIREKETETNLVDYTLLVGPPATTLEAFENPKLRQFPASLENIEWLEFLGYGEEGHVYLANIGDYGRVAVKVFWHTYRAGELVLGMPMWNTFPFKTESQVVDLNQKIAWAMSEVKKTPGQNIQIRRGPKTRDHAKANVLAFSQESWESLNVSANESTKLSPAPPFPRCYGWAKIDNSQLPKVHPPMPQGPKLVGWSWVIVYEYVPAAAPDITIAQTFFDYFYDIGFIVAFRPENWRGGKLVDINDIVSPLVRNWFPEGVCSRNATKLDWTIHNDNCPDRSIVK
ncbi:hypothetical protein F5X99DRAFT_396302 [Biscogniauxia marginata]|nr:hypothetical protein F5X99DRAFT_396302 [Biscogniauxia marginata]